MASSARENRQVPDAGKVSLSAASRERGRAINHGGRFPKVCESAKVFARAKISGNICLHTHTLARRERKSIFTFKSSFSSWPCVRGEDCSRVSAENSCRPKPIAASATTMATVKVTAMKYFQFDANPWPCGLLLGILIIHSNWAKGLRAVRRNFTL